MGPERHEGTRKRPQWDVENTTASVKSMVGTQGQLDASHVSKAEKGPFDMMGDGQGFHRRAGSGGKAPGVIEVY